MRNFSGSYLSSPYSFRMREITDQRTSSDGHFSGSVNYPDINSMSFEKPWKHLFFGVFS